jgi:hypothetical protein
MLGVSIEFFGMDEPDALIGNGKAPF